MSLGNAAESDLLSIIFLNVAWANIGNAGGLAGSSGVGSPGSLYAALHTANPGQAGNQNTSESAYPSYTRIGVARSGAGWTITGSNPTIAENAAAVTYPQSGPGGSTPETQTYFSVGTLSSGAGEYLWYGILTAPLIVNNLITPSFAINALQCTMQ